MVPIMEGRHTVLRLYKPIRERICISLYLPVGLEHSRASLLLSGHGQKKVGPMETRQKQQSSELPGKDLTSSEVTKGAVADLSWIVAVHRQALADLFALCADCAARVQMGNQDGKMEVQQEGGAASPLSDTLSSSNLQHSPKFSPDQKRGTTRGRRLRKLAVKRTDSAEGLLQSKFKMKVEKAVSEGSPFQSGKAPGTSTQESSSCTSRDSSAAPPVEKELNANGQTKEFTVDYTFESDTDICSELSEYDNDLYNGFEGLHSFLGEEQQKLQQEQMLSGDNLRPTEDCGPSSLEVPSAAHDERDWRDAGIRVTARVQGVGGIVQQINHFDCEEPTLDSSSAAKTCGTTLQKRCELTRVSLPLTPLKPEQDKVVVNKPLHRVLEVERIDDSEMWRRFQGSPRVPVVNSKELLSQSVWGPNDSSTASSLKSERSPSSPSLCEVFNTSYPISNSLQSMSPVVSPVTSHITSPQLNHRILLLPEEEGDHIDNQRKSFLGATLSEGEPRVTTEVIDKNGNKKTITRLDLNLFHQGGGSKWAFSSPTVPSPPG